MQKQRDWGTRLGALIADYRGPMSQALLAELVSQESGQKMTQNVVSELERGNRWGKNIDLIGVFARVLRIPTAEVQEIIGLPVPADDGAQAPLTFAEIVSQDTTLSKAAKNHLLNQYELLQMATQHERSGDPVLHEDRQGAQKKKRA